MKSILLLLLWSFSMGINAQELRTLHANEKQVVALFFPHPIRQAVVGSEKFTFSYNKERPQYVGLLQGNMAPKSNLLVLTENGDVFSFLVAYKKTVDTLTYFILEQKSIGRERPIEKIVTDTLTLSTSSYIWSLLGHQILAPIPWQLLATKGLPLSSVFQLIPPSHGAL